MDAVSMLLGGSLVAGGAILHRAYARKNDSSVFVSIPDDGSKYRVLRKDIDKLERSVARFGAVVADLAFAQAEGNAQENLETLLRGAGYTRVQPLLLRRTNEEVFGTQKANAGEPVLIEFADSKQQMQYGVGTHISYHGEFFVPLGRSGEKELHFIDYDGIIKLVPLNIPVSGMFNQTGISNSMSTPDGLISSGYVEHNKQMDFYLARRCAREIAIQQYDLLLSQSKKDTRILSNLLEAAWNENFNHLALHDYVPALKGSKATAFVRARLRQRLSPIT